MKEIRDEMKNLKIGEKIASLQMGSGLTLAGLAARCDLLEIVVSQIERRER